MTHLEELWAITADPAATCNERDAAKELIADIQCGRRLSVACMSVITVYLRKQATQNRWGK